MNQSAIDNLDRYLTLVYRDRDVKLPERILEVGSRVVQGQEKKFPGGLRPVIQAHLGVRPIIGVDVDPGINVDHVVPTTGEILNGEVWPDMGTFGLVFCFDVMEHVPHPHVLMTEIARVLEPGGRLILYVPGRGPTHCQPDYWRFRHDGMILLATEAGLNVERYFREDNSWAARCVIASKPE